MAFCPEHPKWDQNPKFIPLSETTSIPPLSYAESPPGAAFYWYPFMNNWRQYNTLSCNKPTILDKINGKPRPPLPPKSRMGKWRSLALRAASSLIWGGWGFAVPFYFVQDCSWGSRIACPLQPVIPVVQKCHLQWFWYICILCPWHIKIPKDTK